MFLDITQIAKNKLFFNDSKWKKWHYFVVKKLTFKHHGNFYCLNRINENKDCENNINVIMPSKNTEILELNQYQKPDKAAFTT